MSWIKDLFVGSVDKVVDSVGKAADSLFTSDHERLAMKNELEKIKLQAMIDAEKMQLEADKAIEEEVSKRWASDMQSDEPLAKKIRPISLVYLLFFMSVIIVTDSVEVLQFNVKDGYVDLIQTLLLTVFAAYYGGRTVEKVMKKRS